MIRSAAAAVTTALLVGGCAAADKAATQVQAVAQAATSPTLSTRDAAFLDQAGRLGIEAVTFGQLARTQAAHASVRDFGLRMVDADTATNQDLTRLASAKHIAPTLDMDLAHQQSYAALAPLHGRAFDRAYLDGQVADRIAALALFRDEAAHGTDRDVRALAAREVPRLQAHLKLAERLGGHPPPPPAA